MPGWQDLAAKLGAIALGIGAGFAILVIGVRWMLHMSSREATTEARANASEDQLQRLQQGEQRETRFRDLTRPERDRRLLDAYYKRHPERMPRGPSGGSTGNG